MILDADGLYILTQAIREGERGSSLQKQLLEAMRTAHVTLTPNKVEFERLCRALKVGEEEEDKLGKAAELACSVAGRIGENVVLVVKGSSDVICSDSSTWLCDDKGSLRRAGGQGDVLAGLLLTFAVWGFMAAKRMEETKTRRREELQLLRMSCCVAACKVQHTNFNSSSSSSSSSSSCAHGAAGGEAQRLEGLREEEESDDGERRDGGGES